MFSLVIFLNEIKDKDTYINKIIFPVCVFVIFVKNQVPMDI